MTAPAGPFMCATCLGRGGSCGTCRGSGQTWSYVAKLYTPPAAGRGDTDSSRSDATVADYLDAAVATSIRPEDREEVRRKIDEHLAAHAGRPAGDRAQPTEELREIATEIENLGHAFGIAAAGDSARNDLRAFLHNEAISNSLRDFADRIRRALDGA